MPRPTMPLEELGLLCLLEKIDALELGVDGIARYGLLQNGLITDGEPPLLTPEGMARLAELRQWRAELSDELLEAGRKSA